MVQSVTAVVHVQPGALGLLLGVQSAPAAVGIGPGGRCRWLRGRGHGDAAAHRADGEYQTANGNSAAETSTAHISHNLPSSIRLGGNNHLVARTI